MKTQAKFSKKAYDAVIFDCDSTLSAVEAIDHLARLNGQGEAVAKLTDKAMSETGLTVELYAERLNLVQPSALQVSILTEEYRAQVVPGAKEVIAILQRLGKPVFIFSAGVNPAVVHFGEWLGVPAEQVFAVDLDFQDGRYADFNRGSPLTHNEGKKTLASQLKQSHARLALVGDGMNDAAAREAVDCFIGFGGVQPREKVRALADCYLDSPSLWPLLQELLTEAEFSALSEMERRAVQQAVPGT